MKKSILVTGIVVVVLSVALVQAYAWPAMFPHPGTMMSNTTMNGSCSSGNGMMDGSMMNGGHFMDYQQCQQYMGQSHSITPQQCQGMM